jgi:HAD superfamily hydrolase (TIGR01549 family)
MRPKLLFWDFDGVIKESVEVKAQAYFDLFKQFGDSIAKNVKAHHELNGGMSRFEKFPTYLCWAGVEINSSTLECYTDKFSELVLQRVIEAQWVPGAESYLRDNLHQQIFILISATPQEELRVILDSLKLTDCFSGIYGAPISKQEAMRVALSINGVSADNCLMIGDSHADLTAAEANSVPFLLRRHAWNQFIFDTYTGPSVKDFINL